MPFSRFLHAISVLFGVAGTLTLIGAWVAGSGTFLGVSQEHLYNDTLALLTIAILFAIGTNYHQRVEEKVDEKKEEESEK